MYTDFRSIISIIDILVSGALYAHITRHCHRIIIGTASGALGGSSGLRYIQSDDPPFFVV